MQLTRERMERIVVLFNRVFVGIIFYSSFLPSFFFFPFPPFELTRIREVRDYSYEYKVKWLRLMDFFLEKLRRS